jgi:methyl-accepting chemotaxis protein
MRRRLGSPRDWSLRSKLQLAGLGLGFMSMAATVWEASAGASQALETATAERLAAVRETRRRHVEKSFDDLGQHALIIGASESTVEALAGFASAWAAIGPSSEQAREALRRHYEDSGSEAWFPEDRRTQALQHFFAPRALGATSSVGAADLEAYARVHERFHPGVQRALDAFGFYDVMLVEAVSGRVVYTARKGPDLGVSLEQGPYRDTAVASAFRRALNVAHGQPFVIEDFSDYPHAKNAPAAFVGAPVSLAGGRIGAVIIQVSIEELDRVMTGDRQWRADGLGETGQSYVVGVDGRFRSDLRKYIEHAEAFLEQLQGSSVDVATVRSVREQRTAIAHLRVRDETLARLQSRRLETALGVDFFGQEVLRSQAPLQLPGLDWMVVAEISAEEAFAPARRLTLRMVTLGIAIGVVFLIASWFLSRSITRPLQALSEGVARLGVGAFHTRVAATSSDEVGVLARAFNDMAERLEKTTVSKENLELLADRLLCAQEEERTRVARELHDDFAQRFASLALDLGALDRAPASLFAERLTRAKGAVGGLADDLRSLSRRLHPSILDDLGLVAAIESECRLTQERGGPCVLLESEGPADELPKDTQLTLYRTVQEGLRNVVKHAQAQTVQVRLSCLRGRVRLEIADDGKGFRRDEASWRPGLGLASLEERARILGGRFDLEAVPGSGTRVVVEVPM